LLVLLALALPASAQVYDMEKVREPMILLDGLWRFHPGDDSHWADPAFDDSRWPLIRADKSWNEQGYPKLSGFAWYRAKLLIPEDQGNLSLTIPQVIVGDGRTIRRRLYRNRLIIASAFDAKGNPGTRTPRKAREGSSRRGPASDRMTFPNS
jgi:hypothetical protein